MNRANTLDTAKKMVCGDRQDDYGTPENNFHEIAKLWTAYMGVEFSPHDVAILMALLKIGRIKTGTAKNDSYIDCAGYIACASEIILPEESEIKYEPKAYAFTDFVIE